MASLERTTNVTGVMPVKILLVEDNPDDIRLTQEAFKAGTVRNELSVVPDGMDALAFLRREEHYASAATPDIILLDLNVSGKGGREVLAEIKADPRLRRIPVVVMGASEDEQDVAASYALHASSYIVKPIDPDRFLSIIQSIEGFWLSVVKLPRE